MGLWSVDAVNFALVKPFRVQFVLRLHDLGLLTLGTLPVRLVRVGAVGNCSPSMLHVLTGAGHRVARAEHAHAAKQRQKQEELSRTSSHLLIPASALDT